MFDQARIAALTADHGFLGGGGAHPSGIDVFLETLKQDLLIAAFLAETAPHD